MTGPRPAYFGGKARPPARYNPHGNVLPAVTPKPRPYRDPALTLVEQILALQQKPLDAAEARRQQQVGIQQHDLEAARSALVAQLQQGAQTGGAAYDQAIGQTDALGRQAASYFQSQNPDAQTQATLKAIGAPLSQQQELGKLNDGLFNGGPNYVLGAQIPGASLAAQKAAHVGELAGLPTVAALQGQLGERDLLGRSADAHAQYTQGLQQILAQAPQLVHQYQTEAYNQAVAEANAARTYQIKAAALLQNAKIAAANMGLKGKQLDLAITKEQHAYEVATRNADISADRANTYAVGTNNTDLNAQERNRIAAENARTARIRATQAAAAAKVKTGKQNQSFFYTQRSKAITAAKAYAGTGGSAPTGPSGIRKQGGAGGVSRTVARTRLMRTFAPPLIARGFKKSTVRQMIEAALDIGYGKVPKVPGAPSGTNPLNPLGT